MKIAITGASGLVGTELSARLRAEGHQVLSVVRRAPRGPEELQWDTERGIHDLGLLEGLDAVVHFAGEGIAERRWSPAQKGRIRDSRVQGTNSLVRSLVKLECKPSVFVSASAIGYYGDRGDEVLDESSSHGMGFLAEVCQAWEMASAPLAEAGTRVVHMRFGVVLSPRGGALAKMLLPFKLGAGGRLGKGDQFMSWISLGDAARAVQHVLETPGVSGPVNGVAPNPVTNAEYTQALGRTLRRPTILPMPAFAARLAFGEMADALLLSSARVLPRALLEAGFRFESPEIGDALDRLLRAS